MDFRNQENEHGKIERDKARLVALGYRQTLGIDHKETYSPVAGMNSIRVFHPYCCHFGACIQQFDVDTAFLNGRLEEEVYIYPPKDVEVDRNKVFKLNRSLYGLKQAAAAWYKTISRVIVAMDFKQCKSDSCVFIRKRNESTVEKEIDPVIKELSNRFDLKRLGKVRFILGIEVDYDTQSKKMKLSQQSSITRMVQRFIQGNAKSTYNPCVQGQFSAKIEDTSTKMKNRPHRSLVGSLLYISNGTRPDISFAVCQLSRHLEHPSE
uniref:Putative polyprotein n=1 Tax=Albugo laibachii Nc14 TaxID=890382 RepID=F0WDN1_9STRA|nr:putative polyprotein [Albugo laibachii Nc14]|eukprot:CCA19307.1 putative polyprotein [Albugo laibachii Nc14]